MRHNLVVASACVLLLGPAPSVAADWSGFYLGIYAGASVQKHLQARGTVIDVDYGDDGGIEFPDSYINSGGVDPIAFALLNQTVGQYVPGGVATADIGSGTISHTLGVTLGSITGYSFGNGFRVEADISGTVFAPADLVLGSVLRQNIDGRYRGPGKAWTWTLVSQQNLTNATPLDGSELGSAAVFALADTWFDFDNASPWTPYVGGGVGLAHVLATLNIPGENPVTFSALAPAGQVGAGVTVDVGDAGFIDLGSRLKATAPLDAHFSGANYDLTIGGSLLVYTLQAGFNARIR